MKLCTAISLLFTLLASFCCNAASLIEINTFEMNLKYKKIAFENGYFEQLLLDKLHQSNQLEGYLANGESVDNNLTKRLFRYQLSGSVGALQIDKSPWWYWGVWRQVGTSRIDYNLIDLKESSTISGQVLGRDYEMLPRVFIFNARKKIQRSYLQRIMKDGVNQIVRQLEITIQHLEGQENGTDWP